MTPWQTRVIITICKVLLRMIKQVDFDTPHEEVEILQEAVDRRFDDYDGK